jgi:hypothetical protein
MKRHLKGHFGYLYYSCKVESGGFWRMTQLLGHSCLKNLTHVIKVIDISLVCVELGLTNWFLTSCFVNKSLSPV